MAGKWVSDESPEISIEGNVVKCLQGNPTGNVFNALWKDGDGLTSGTAYWKIYFDGKQDGVFAGLTDLEKFKKGWAMKGLMYGGNLSNGGALLVGGFGPRIKDNDVLGILAVIENGFFKVYFDLNDSPLGLAFELPQSVLNAVFPVVHFSAPGAARIEKVDELPKSLIRPPVIYEGITGDWKLVDNEFKVNSAVHPVDINVTMRLKKQDSASGETYAVHLQVINNMNFTLQRSGRDQPWVTPGGRMSTMMGSTPELMKLESTISQLTTDPTQVELSGEILLVNNSTHGMESKWQRYSTAKEPVKTNPFN